MKYTIRVSYETGNSFNIYANSQEVGVFDGEISAIGACNDILDHYNLYLMSESYKCKVSKKLDPLKILKKKKYWNGEESDYAAFASLITQGQTIHCFWIGFLEQLLSLQVVPMDDELIFYPTPISVLEDHVL